MGPPAGYEIDVLERGVAESDELARELREFWSAHGVLGSDDARGRLPHVICVLRDGDGRVAATSSAVDGIVTGIGNRRFWIYRCFAPTPEARASVERMLIGARDHLAERVGADGVRPLGICFPIGDPRLIAERDEAVWPESGLLFAGWTEQGEQLRVCYFEGAKIL